MTTLSRRVAFGRLGSAGLCMLALACGDSSTGPSNSAIGPFGPVPPDLTGQVAFVTTEVITTSSGSHLESKVHVVDMASLEDMVIYTAPANVSIQGLSWAPDAQRLVAQTFFFRVDANGANRSIWQLHSLNIPARRDVIIFGSSGPQYHPAYGSTGQLAYFAGWSDDPAAGIFVDGHPRFAVPFAGSSYLSWTPDGSAIVYSGQGLGLQQLTLENGNVVQLLAPEDGEVIQEPAVLPNGERIAMVRFGGNRNQQEIWTVSSSGDSASQLTAGSSDGSPAWTPNGTYLAFMRGGSGAPGIYVIPAAGGTPQLVVGVSGFSIGSISWSR